MRILMISDVYFPRINGVSTSIQTFRRGLHAAGHETVLIAPEYPSSNIRTRAEEPIIRVPSRYLPRDPEDRILRQNALRSLRPELKRGRLRSRAHPDAVHCSLLRCQRRPGARRAGDRDVSHLLRRVSASLRAADSTLGDALRRASVSRCPNVPRSMRSSCRRGPCRRRCEDYGVALSHAHHSHRHGDGTFRERRRPSVSRACSAFLPIDRRWCTSAASLTKRTSISCCECLFAS